MQKVRRCFNVSGVEVFRLELLLGASFKDRSKSLEL